METFWAVLIGIISSLIATFFFLFLNWLIKKVVLPWYEDKIYRGVRVDGLWNVETFNGVDLKTIPDKFRASFQLSQKGDGVTGIYTHVDSSNNEIDSYRVTGEIRNTFLTISLWPLKVDSIDAGSVVLHVYSSKGAKMSGILTYIDPKSGSVESAELLLSKNSSQK